MFIVNMSNSRFKKNYQRNLKMNTKYETPLLLLSSLCHPKNAFHDICNIPEKLSIRAC